MRRLLILCAIFAPLKLSVTYIFLVPLLIWFMIKEFKEKNFLRYQPGIPEALIVFLCVLAITSFFSLSLIKSLDEIISLFFYSTLVFFLRDYVARNGSEEIIKALAFGFGIASINTILNGLFPFFIPRLFLGQISEAGQLALFIPILVGLGAYKAPNLALFIPALILNLKRGPWLGVLLTVLVFALVQRKFRLLGVLICVTVITTLLSPQVQARFYSLEHDFLDKGGRKEMWEVAWNLVQRNPLGVGLNNSRIIREYSERIPRELSHFHNNAINILVESGFLGLFVFIWLMFYSIKSLLKYRETLPYALALLSSQIAGLVEYNFGDSKVFLLTLFVLGIGAGELSKKELIPRPTKRDV
jgi:O-antigen ligase